MNYFEITKRLAALSKFLALYNQYTSFTNRVENPAAQELLKEMKPLVPLTIESLRLVRVGTIVTHDAPARGGKSFRINVIKAIFRHSLIQHFRLDDEGPRQALEMAIVKYDTRRSRAFVQLFNPLFWLIELVAFGADIPYALLEKIGFELDDFRKTGAARAIKGILLLLIIAGLVKMTGLWDWIQEFLR